MNTEVWVVEYDHKHGVDITVCSSEKAAQQCMEEIVENWRDDFNVPEDVSNADAIEKWADYSGGTEYLRCNKQNVYKEAPSVEDDVQAFIDKYKHASLINALSHRVQEAKKNEAINLVEGDVVDILEYLRQWCEFEDLDDWLENTWEAEKKEGK